MVPEPASRKALVKVMVGANRTSTRRFTLAAVLVLGVFGVLFTLLAWNVLNSNSTIIVGVWVLLGGWTVVIPVLYAYKNDGLLVSWLLASIGPFAVGVVLAVSPALAGSQTNPIDVLGFALELTLDFGLPVGAIGFAIGSWARIASNLSGGQVDTERMKDKYAILAGTAFLLAIPITKLGLNTPKDVLASQLDVLLMGIAVVGSAVGLLLLRLLFGES